jgi:hypothetical protein
MLCPKSRQEYSEYFGQSEISVDESILPEEAVVVWILRTSFSLVFCVLAGFLLFVFLPCFLLSVQYIGPFYILLGF